jgi:hypothetical protein
MARFQFAFRLLLVATFCAGCFSGGIWFERERQRGKLRDGLKHFRGGSGGLGPYPSTAPVE